jgi:hypothetical protein
VLKNVATASRPDFPDVSESNPIASYPGSTRVTGLPSWPTSFVSRDDCFAKVPSVNSPQKNFRFILPNMKVHEFCSEILIFLLCLVRGRCKIHVRATSMSKLFGGDTPDPAEEGMKGAGRGQWRKGIEGWTPKGTGKLG